MRSEAEIRARLKKWKTDLRDPDKRYPFEVRQTGYAKIGELEWVLDDPEVKITTKAS